MQNDETKHSTIKIKQNETKPNQTKRNETKRSHRCYIISIVIVTIVSISISFTHAHTHPLTHSLEHFCTNFDCIKRNKRNRRPNNMGYVYPKGNFLFLFSTNLCMHIRKVRYLHFRPFIPFVLCIYTSIHLYIPFSLSLTHSFFLLLFHFTLLFSMSIQHIPCETLRRFQIWNFTQSHCGMPRSHFELYIV